MRTEERTDVTKLTVAFRNFANAPKKCHTMRHCNGNLESVHNTQEQNAQYCCLDIYNITLNIQCDVINI